MLLIVARGAQTHQIPPLYVRRRILIPDLKRKVRSILEMIDVMHGVSLAIPVIDLSAALAFIAVERKDLGPFAQPLAPLVEPVRIVLYAPPRVCYF